ncbi:hypothetical protein ACFY2J_37635 [Streptomyces collinus]
MANVRVTYDKVANAAYVYFTDPQVRVNSAHMYLPAYLLEAAERLDSTAE